MAGYDAVIWIYVSGIGIGVILVVVLKVGCWQVVVTGLCHEGVS